MNAPIRPRRLGAFCCRTPPRRSVRAGIGRYGSGPGIGPWDRALGSGSAGRVLDDVALDDVAAPSRATA
jgi:hypothetical protein